MIKTETCPCCAGKKKMERNLYSLPPNEDKVIETIGVDCKMCDGKGTVQVLELCFTCNGKKYLHKRTDESKCFCTVYCPTCEGNGYIERGTHNEEGGLLNRFHEDSLPNDRHQLKIYQECEACSDRESKRWR